MPSCKVIEDARCAPFSELRSQRARATRTRALARNLAAADASARRFATETTSFAARRFSCRVTLDARIAAHTQTPLGLFSRPPLSAILNAMRRTTRALLVLLALPGCLVSCNQRKDSATKPAAAEPTLSVAPPAPEPTRPPEPVTAPFTVMLQAPDKAAKGPVELSIDIDSQKGFAGETEISVQLPKTAKLVSGMANEKLQSLPQGKTTRTFKVTSPKLSADDPVRIVVEGRDPKGTFGARAERVYPERGSQ